MGVLGQLRDELYIADAELRHFNVREAFAAIPYESRTAPQSSPWKEATSPSVRASLPASPQRAAVRPARELVAARKPALAESSERLQSRPLEREPAALFTPARESAGFLHFHLEVPVGFRFNLLRLLRPVLRTSFSLLCTVVTLGHVRTSASSSAEQPESPPPAKNTEDNELLVACDLHSPPSPTLAPPPDERTQALERAARLAQLERESELEARLISSRSQAPGGSSTPPGLSPVRGLSLANLALSHYEDSFEFDPPTAGSVFPASRGASGSSSRGGSGAFGSPESWLSSSLYSSRRS